jgi:hypothetical protein
MSDTSGVHHTSCDPRISTWNTVVVEMLRTIIMQPAH